MKQIGAFLFLTTSAGFICYAKLQQQQTPAKGEKGRSRKDLSLKNSVKKYDRHLIIVYKSGYQWGKDIAEESDSFAHSLSMVVGALPDKVKVTGCAMEEGTDNDECRDLILYPDAVVISGVLKGQIDLLVGELASGQIKSFSVENCPWKKLILVCTHSTRDKRCGSKGKEYFNKLKALYESRQDGPTVKVLQSSHVGGHEFAPTMLTYPSADYFGNLNVTDIESLSSCIDSCGSCDLTDVTSHRGNAGCSTSWLKT